METKAEAKGSCALQSLEEISETSALHNLASLLRKKRVRQRLRDFVSENAVKVLQLLLKTTDDEKIAEKLGCKVSEVRATLNKLHELGIVRYDRSKNPSTGWYTYSWYINPQRFVEWLEEEQKAWKRLLERGEEYYACPVCGLKAVFDFSQAFERGFKCPYCEQALELVDDNFLKKMR